MHRAEIAPPEDDSSTLTDPSASRGSVGNKVRVYYLSSTYPLFRIPQPQQNEITPPPPYFLFCTSTLMGIFVKQNPAVLAYDKTGLRSAMSATWEEMEKSLEANKVVFDVILVPNNGPSTLSLYMHSQADHLVRYEWENDISSLIKYAEERGLPPVGGRPVKIRVTKRTRTAYW